MDGKKKYLVLALLLLLLGFGAITFAGNDEELEPAGGNDSQVEKDNDLTPERVDDVINDVSDNQELLDDNNDNTNVVNNANPGVTNGNQGNGNANPVLPQVDPATLIAEVEKMVGSATKKEDVDGAESYYDDNKVKDLTEALENGENKEKLLERVEKLEQIFGDNVPPQITGINPNEVTNKPVTITITDDLEVTKTVTKNGEEAEFVEPFTEDGVYTITVTDEAHNVNDITFTIDTVAPKANIESGKHYNKFTLNVEEDNKFTIVVTKNHSEKYEVSNGTEFTEDATYMIVITDEAGNSVTIWTAIDNQIPSIVVTDTVVENVACKKVTVTDRYLMNLFINETKYTRNDFSKGVNNEYFKYENTICEEGEYVVLAEDKIGNSYSEMFTIDRSEPEVSYSTIRFTNKKAYRTKTYSEYTDTYYVTDGDKFTYAIAFEEKLAHAPKLTIGGKNVTLKLVEKETYRDEQRIYLYEGTMEVLKSDNFAQGELKVELSDVVDEFGNEVTDVAILNPNETTNHRVVSYDNVAAKLSYVAILSKKDNYDKAIKGDTIRFLVRFNEEMNTDNFKLKFDGKVLKFVKSQDVGYEYIIDYKIPQDTKMKTGYLTFEVFGYTDKAGNGGDPITVANHKTYNKVYFDAIAPTITLVGNQGKENNEHRVIAGSRVYLDYVLATVTDNSLDAPIEIEPVNVVKFYPSETGKSSHKYKYEEYYVYKTDANNKYILDENGDKILEKTYYYFDTETPGERYHLEFEYTDDSGYTTKRTMILAVDGYKNPVGIYNQELKANVIEVTKNVNNGYIPFYNVIDNTEAVVINGNNHTVTQTVVEDAFYWGSNGTRSMLGNIFSSTNGSKITINDLTFKGTTGTISLGKYKNATYNNYNTELNNVNIVGLNVVSFSSNVSPGVVVYGKATFNNVNLYGTKLSSLDTNPMYPVYDLVVVNYSKAIFNSGKVGSVYTWNHAGLEFYNTEVDTIYAYTGTKQGGTVIGNGTTVKNLVISRDKAVITIKSGAVVETLDYNNISDAAMTIVIEDGAVVKNIINKK